MLFLSSDDSATLQKDAGRKVTHIFIQYKHRKAFLAQLNRR